MKFRLVLICLLGIGLFASILPTLAQDALEDTVPVTYSIYQLSVPQDWLSWVYDPKLSEQENETALIRLVQQIEPAAVTEARPVIEDSIPGFVIASLNPRLVGDDLMFVAATEYSLSASLADLQLPASATDQQVLEALGLITPQLSSTDIPWGYWLEQSDATSFYVAYVIRQSDSIMIVAGALSNQSVGDLRLDGTQEDVLNTVSDLVSNNDTFRQLASVATSLNVSSTHENPQIALDQCPNSVNLGEFSAANTNLYSPFSVPLNFTVGQIDLTTLDIQPLELEPTQGSDFVFPLAGYITDANCPDAYFTALPCPDPLRCSVSVIVTAAGAFNPSILMRQPDGLYVFGDIVQPGGNLDPAVAARPTSERTIPSGTYMIWIGGHNPGETIQGTLLIIVQ